MPWRALPALFALTLLGSCISVRWNRMHVDEPVGTETARALRPGTDDLATCLARLGAPNAVQRGPERTMDLIWSWQDTSDWGISISYRVAQFVSPSLRYSEVNQNIQGLRLRFDEEWQLVDHRTGPVHELLRDPDRERHGDRHRRADTQGPYDRPF